MIELDVEEPVISQSILRSGLSFGVSLVSHLVLLLLLAILAFGARQPGIIEIEASTLVEDTDMFESIPTKIELESNMDVVELDADELTEEQDLLQAEDMKLAVDWDANVNPTNLKDQDVLSDSELFAATDEGGFFGIEATGNRIVYIIDMSPSMDQDMGVPSFGTRERRYDRAIEQVLSSVAQLKPDQQFYVIMFSYQMRELKLGDYSGYYPPTREIRNELGMKLRSLKLSFGTDPRESLVTALKLKPTCCFLLSDGEFNGKRDGMGPYGRGPTAVTLAKRFNKSRSPIHTIGLADRGSQAAMSAIAKNSKGTYKFIPSDGDL